MRILRPRRSQRLSELSARRGLCRSLSGHARRIGGNLRCRHPYRPFPRAYGSDRVAAEENRENRSGPDGKLLAAADRRRNGADWFNAIEQCPELRLVAGNVGKRQAIEHIEKGVCGPAQDPGSSGSDRPAGRCWSPDRGIPPPTAHPRYGVPLRRSTPDAAGRLRRKPPRLPRTVSR